MSSHPDYDLRFKCTVIGNTLIIERDDDYTWINGWDHDIYFRVYDPSKADEQVPESFDSSSPHPYFYHGLPHEQAPHFVKHVVVHESVKIILPHAFYKCTKMTKCTMHSGVERIEKRAFYGCYGLQSICLPKASLTHIGFGAFESCHVLGCIYVPPTVTYIGNRAFAGCIGAKILVLPSKDESPDLDARQMIFLDCIYLLRNSNMTYEFERNTSALLNNDEMNEWMQHRYDHLPMHKLCADPHVTAERICNFTKQYGTAAAYDTTDPANHKMTPLHILCSINRGNVNLDTIAACFDANPGALFTPDASNTTPLEYLEETEGNMHIIIHLMQDLSIYRKETYKYRFRPLKIAMRQCVAFVKKSTKPMRRKRRRKLQ
eukprot:CAMPEP_0204620450 /NCGR_PEP_ID=MMETSP0717-20131115/6483_1 /ASSEMBLY_ACC=CAM_ASM_000666 /TAXON_ID=230516 /ORGANISM="Chaetoceros curvisetus" /LENGTH=374 /DNA_ID=CAMNT_0051634655 /DNA_START=11 /DNA_END=1135 /DNA_ORIENTATION=-